jgi:proteasome lid subunit RPN8/RPN11
MRIVSEEKRPVQAMPRPSPARVHPWETDLQAKTGLYIDPAAAASVERQLSSAAKAGVESMGLLLGDRFEDGEGALYSVAAAAVTAPVQASSTHVRWAQKAMDDLAGALEAPDFESVIVGMYHSHLGGDCLPSQIDVDNQRKYFASPHQVSWILNPSGKRSAAFALVADQPTRRRVAVLAGGPRALDDYLRPKAAP